MADLPSVINIGSLTADQGVIFVGGGLNETAGRSVQIISDINGDGLADILIGAWTNSAGGTNAGAAYVVFGKAGGFNTATFDLATLDGTNGFRITGEPFSSIGNAVAGLPDINGDGYNDLIVDSPTNATGGTQAGGAYVIFGGPSFAASISVGGLDGSNGFQIVGTTPNTQLGWAVSSAGDLNGDGIGDLVLSSQAADSGRGASFVLFGRDDASDPYPENYTADAAGGIFILGEAPADRAGRSIASAGDVNGDGFDDLIIGAYRRNSWDGAAYIVFGRDGAANPFDQPINLADLSTSGQGLRISGPLGRGAGLGQSVASAGDVNGDGIDDVMISAGNNQAVYVLFGGAHLTTDFNIADITSAQGFVMRAASASTFGGAVSPAGDINGDGFDDMIIGAYTAGGLAGAALIVLGRADFGTSLNLDVASGVTRINGLAAWDQLGRSVGGGGDVNGDGRADVIAGTQFYDPWGAAVLIYSPPAAINYAGTTGNDVQSGGALADSLSGGGGEDELSGLDGDDVLDGGDGADKLYGGLGADDLVGGAGGDLLDGGAGADQMAGGDGDDTYVVDDIGDAVSELGGSGIDRVRASVNFTLGDGVENLQLTGTANISGVGNSLANQIDGNSGDNIIFGGGGNDIIRGAGGLDQLQGDSGSDQLRGGDGDDQIFGGADNDWIYGDADNDALFGGGGNDIIDGGTGADTLYGEAGADQLNGGDGDDYLSGGADNDLLRGGAGSDSLEGGTGDDTYFIDDTLDRIFENPGEGNDIVRASISYTLGDNLERLILEGSAANGTGNGLANVITGNAEANVLDGAAGADTISGGLGDDTIIGGTGNDILTGGGGSDSFVVRAESVFSSSDPQGRSIETDTISDYAIGQDIIDLSGIDAIAGGADDAFSIVGAFDGVAGRMTLTFAGGITTLLLDIDGDRVADYRLRINGDVRADTADWVL